MISVAMTTYNGAKYIVQQLESIRNQTMKVDEVIICDDGSKDDTIKIIRQYIKDHSLSTWILIANEKNLGYSNNFFKAVHNCSGEYIFLCDQDDIWHSQKVERIANYLLMNPNVYCVSSGFVEVQIDSQVSENDLSSCGYTATDVHLDEVVCSSNIKGCTMCIRREVDRLVAHDDIDVNKQLGHDWYYNYISCLIGRNVHLKETLLFYRVHGGNISLQRRHRTNVLASSYSKRIAIFDEMIEAPSQVLDSARRSICIEEKDITKIKQIINFTRCRRDFVNGRLALIFKLATMNGYYRKVSGSNNWIHAFLSDCLYAFKINWRVR